jgi:hypothetical protein
MKPLEERWPGDGGSDRPYYVLTDQVKGPDLLGQARNIPSLRARVRGTGLTPGQSSADVVTAFELDYRGRYGEPPNASGAGPSFDATYALAYALAATRDLPVSGPSIAKGLRKLAGGPTAPNVGVGSNSILSTFSRLSMAEPINMIGTYVPFEWDERGAVVNRTIEIWCIGAASGAVAYGSANLTYDINTGKFTGAYAQCP